MRCFGVEILRVAEVGVVRTSQNGQEYGRYGEGGRAVPRWKVRKAPDIRTSGLLSQSDRAAYLSGRDDDTERHRERYQRRIAKQSRAPEEECGAIAGADGDEWESLEVS